MTRGVLVMILSLAATGCTATTVYVGPRFVTGVPGQPDAAAVEVAPDGRIVAVHQRVPDGAATVQLRGKLAVPGLHDAHLHLMGIGRRSEQIDLRGVKSPAELRQRIVDFDKAHPAATAIVGRGWDQSLFADRRYPTWRDIEGATAKPVWVRRVDGHAGLASSSLMKKAGITAAMADPAGGRILRGDDGAATGIFTDRAMELIGKHLPQPSTADRMRWVRLGADASSRGGLVAVHDMAVDLATLAAMEVEDAARPLPLRIYVYLDGDDEQAYQWLANNTGAARVRSPRIEVRGIKLFADGAMGSRGAALLADYSDRPGQRGQLLLPVERLKALTRKVHGLGAQLAIHAIGDRGNRVTLDAIAAAQGDDRSRRHRLEHAQLLHLDDLPRLQKLGVVASMQPTHATSDMRWAKARVGASRLPGAYAWQRVHKSGAILAFGSDAPVESERVLLGLHAATTRTDEKGQPIGGWLPDQKLDDSAALAAFSLGPARAIGREEELGALAPGRRFDVSVFDGDPRGQVGGWLKVRPVVTVIDGKVAWQAQRPD